MNIVIADFGSDKRDRFGSVERQVCRLARELVEKGNRVMVLHRDDVNGQYLFPLAPQVIEKGIDIYGRPMPLSMKVVREVVRLFHRDKARKMSTAYNRKAAAAAIRPVLAAFLPDEVIACSVDAAACVHRADSRVRVTVLPAGNPNSYPERNRKAKQGPLFHGYTAVYQG